MPVDSGRAWILRLNALMATGQALLAAGVRGLVAGPSGVELGRSGRRAHHEQPILVADLVEMLGEDDRATATLFDEDFGELGLKRQTVADVHRREPLNLLAGA